MGHEYEAGFAEFGKVSVFGKNVGCRRSSGLCSTGANNAGSELLLDWWEKPPAYFSGGEFLSNGGFLGTPARPTLHANGIRVKARLSGFWNIGKSLVARGLIVGDANLGKSKVLFPRGTILFRLPHE
jgi:hypothetical protein